MATQQPQQMQGGVADQVISFIHQITSRDGTLSKDSKMVNCYPEQTENGPAAVKRPGLVALAPAGAPGRGQGLIQIVSVEVAFVAGQMYYLTNPLTLQAGGFDIAPNATEPFYTVDSTIPGLGFTGALVKQARGMWLGSLTGAGATAQFNKVTDVDYPSITVPGVVTLDQTTYVMDVRGNIRGSDLANPSSWSALNTIAVDPLLGQAVALHRHLNYAIAFCDNGMQFYYDAANPTGSPLSPVPNASYRTGCATGFSVAEVDDVTYFIGKSSNTRGRGVFALAGVEIVEVGNPHINKILNAAVIPSDVEQSVLRCYGLKVGGHSFYVLNLINANITLVYDITYQHWHQWTSTVAGVEQYFVGGFVGLDYALRGAVDRAGYIQDYSTGSVYSISETAYQDAGNVINVLIRTKPYDWGTLRRKFFAGLYLLADTVAATIAVSYSDDDYQTSSTPRNIDLSTVKKMLQRVGSSRRRSWDFRHTANTPLKLYGAEVPMDVGN